MAVNPNEDTEFNDALRKHGILPPRESTPPTPPPPPSPTLDELLADFSPSELREIGEDIQNDEMERAMESYRRQRIAQDRTDQRRARFGEVYPISRESYTSEVTEASNVNEEDDEDEKGTGVVCFLYKDGVPHSDRAWIHVRILAQKYPRTKFVSIVGDKCIPNLPASRIPMFIMYRKGEIRNQIFAWGADKERRIEELEALFIAAGVIDLPERPSVERQKGRLSDDEDEEDEDEDPSSRRRSAATGLNARVPKNIRSSSKNDDSDFEFDL